MIPQDMGKLIGVGAKGIVSMGFVGTVGLFVQFVQKEELKDCSTGVKLQVIVKNDRNLFGLQFLDVFGAKAHQDPRQMVLPFAVAERDFGPFAALRSQNYSNFLGREGVTFQDIDQPPFQKMLFVNFVLPNINAEK